MSVRSVVVVHRERMVAEGVAAGLAGFSGLGPIAVATQDAGSDRWTSEADAVAMDPALPGADALAGQLRAKGVRVVFLGPSMDEDDGIRVSTDQPLSALASALVPGSQRARSVIDALTQREREVLVLVASGLAGKQVAKRLGISPKTVEQHKTRIYAKLSVPNQAAAVSLLRKARGVNDGEH